MVYFLSSMSKLFIYRFQLSNNFFLFLVVTFLSVAVTYLQKEVINKMIVKTKFGRKTVLLLTTLF